MRDKEGAPQLGGVYVKVSNYRAAGLYVTASQLLHPDHCLQMAVSVQRASPPNSRGTSGTLSVGKFFPEDSLGHSYFNHVLPRTLSPLPPYLFSISA